jgi:uncharacterized protein
MLTLNLAKIRTAHEQVDRSFEPGQVETAGEDFVVVGPVRLVFDVFKDKDRFRLAGRVTTMLDLACGRCLDPFPLPIDQTFDVRYQPRELDASGGEREIDDDDLATSVYEDNVIDLGQLVIEQCYLSLPMKPLCSEGCRGLCPTCGTNLNRGTCGCVRDWEDPRFAALRAFATDVKRES